MPIHETDPQEKTSEFGQTKMINFLPRLINALFLFAGKQFREPIRFAGRQGNVEIQAQYKVKAEN